MEITLGTWRFCIDRTPLTPVELVAYNDESASRWHERLGHLGYEQAYDTFFVRRATSSKGISPTS